MKDILESLKKNGLLRSLNACECLGANMSSSDGKTYLNFSSNDYLGLSGRLDLQREFLEKTLDAADSKFLLGSTSSRLITGTCAACEDFESCIKNAYGKEAALLFNSGYHANTGILPALAQPQDLILADKLIHASLIDALKLSKCKFLRFAHNNIDHLEKLLKLNRDKFKRIYIVTESVFSMDGDFANLPALAELKNRYGATLYVDEAHAVGVFGKSGLGLGEEFGTLENTDITMCTLGKALGGEGAFAVCSNETKQMLVNFSRSLIYTTAMPPINVLWARATFEKMRNMHSERESIKRNMRLLRERINSLGGQSQIAPLVIGSNEDCLNFSEYLKKLGVWAGAIRHPTVPLGTARIRFSISAAHSEENVEYLANAVNSALETLGAARGKGA